MAIAIIEIASIKELSKLVKDFMVDSSEFGVRSMPYGHAARTEFGVLRLCLVVMIATV